jgi:hypothetical protein
MVAEKRDLVSTICWTIVGLGVFATMLLLIMELPAVSG